MATVPRAPFYAPRPPDDQPWQGRPTESALLAPLLTNVTFYGRGGQAPTKRWNAYYDYNSAESFWSWDALSALIPLLTNVKFYGAGGQAPTKRWQFHYDYDVGESVWQGETRQGRNFKLLALGAQPITNEPWKFSYLDDAFWQGGPTPSALLAPLLTSAGKAKPRLSWNFGQDDSSYWQFATPFNLSLASNIQFPVSRGGGWNAPDEVGLWQRLPRRNTTLLTVPAAAAPLNGPVWKFNYSETSDWQGKSGRSAAISLLTLVNFYGAGGQAPTKTWRYDYDVGGAFWQGRPIATRLQSLPAATTFYGAAGQVPTTRWSVYYNYNSGESLWQGRPVLSNIRYLPATSPGTPDLINAYTEQVGANDDRLFRTWWMGMANGNIGEAVPRAPTRDRCWQVWGTFGGGSVAIEGSNDGVTYFTLHDKLGNPAILLTPGIVEVIEVPHSVRPRVSTGSSGTDVTVILTQRQGWR